MSLKLRRAVKLFIRVPRGGRRSYPWAKRPQALSEHRHEAVQVRTASAAWRDINRGHHADRSLRLLELTIGRGGLGAMGTQDDLELEFLRPAAVGRAVRGAHLGQDLRLSRAGDCPELHLQAGAGDRFAVGLSFDAVGHK